MSESKHTPRPRSTVTDMTGYKVEYTMDGRGIILTIPDMGGASDNHLEQIAIERLMRAAEDARRDESLINDLLEALEAALIKMENDEVQIDGEWGGCRSIEKMEAQDDIAGEILKARSAIAKARGLDK